MLYHFHPTAKTEIDISNGASVGGPTLKYSPYYFNQEPSTKDYSNVSSHLQKMSAEAATASFIIYSALNGVTFSLLLLIYTGASIASTFMITALTFGAMSAYGYFTKRDLTSMGSYLRMALFGLIIASVINIFWANGTMYWIISYVGVLLFVGLTAYDTQKIKRMGASVEGVQTTQKVAIMGALMLYLDFINLFLMLLRILGGRK